MLNIKKNYYSVGAAFTMGMLINSTSANAAGNNFSSIAGNMTTSISSLPGLVSSVAYLIGILIAVLGILKIKDHVENPTQTPLKDGVIRVVTGGALFALPIVLESALNTVGTGDAVQTARLNRISLDGGLTGAP